MKTKSFKPVVVARSGFRAGSLKFLQLRPSVHSPSGCVVVCSFSCPIRAGIFAALWAGRLGACVTLRRSAGFFAVSVPVKVHTVYPPGAGRLVQIKGGIKSLRAALVLGGCAF